MADLLQQGMAWLAAQRKAHMAREVVYARGAASAALSATVGRTEFVQVDEYGIDRKSESRDYLFTAADLVLGGVLITPARGDRVRERVGDAWLIYEVGPPAGVSEPAFKWSGSERITLRVHTHFVGQEAA